MNRPPILAECHICGEPHTLTRMVHKWDYSYCLVCADLTNNNQQKEPTHDNTN